MINIGIGVITTGNRIIHDYKISGNSELKIYTDTERAGAATARNELLKYFYDKGYDYFFLFDDDCYPTMAGWEEYFIGHAQEYCIDFLGIPEIFKSNLLGYKEEVVFFDSIIGCFNFQTRKFMDQVGYYNTDYEKYGYEDTARNHRALRSGLCGNLKDGFPSLLRASAYIHSEDVFAEDPPVNMVMEEKLKYVKMNEPIFAKEANGELYYGFTSKKGQ